MAYDEFLADRIRNGFNSLKVPFEEKKMMGGLCFMVDDKMCVGVNGEDLMARLQPDKQADYLLRTGAREMDFTGRPMKGFVFVGGEGIDTEDSLTYWLQEAVAFNPLAKSSKKKAKKKSA